MTESFFSSFGNQAKDFLAPVPKLQRLVLESIEKAAELQVDLIKSYAELSAKQFRDMSEIRDAEGLKAFASSQTEFLGTIGRKVLEDVQALNDLGSQFREEAARIVRQTVEGEAEFEPVEDTEPKAKKA